MTTPGERGNMRPWRAPLPLALSALVAASCGGPEPASAPSEPGSVSTTPADDPTADTTSPTSTPPDDAGDLGATPVITMVDAGAEPRQVLELDPAPGQRSTLEMRMDVANDISVDGQPQPSVEMPTVVMVMDAQVEDVSDLIRTVVSYEDVALDGPDPGGLLDVLETMEGITGTITTTRSGAFVEGSIAPPEGTLDPSIAPFLEQMDQQLAAMTVPLPSDPIGVGAVWRAATSLTINGVTVDNEATYTLASLDGTAYALDVELALQYAAGQVGPGVEIVQGAGSGTGRSAGRLDFPFAVEASVTSDAEVVFELTTTSGQTQTMQQQVHTRMEMAPRP